MCEQASREIQTLLGHRDGRRTSLCMAAYKCHLSVDIYHPLKQDLSRSASNEGVQGNNLPQPCHIQSSGFFSLPEITPRLDKAVRHELLMK